MINNYTVQDLVVKPLCLEGVISCYLLSFVLEKIIISSVGCGWTVSCVILLLVIKRDINFQHKSWVMNEKIPTKQINEEQKPNLSTWHVDKKFAKIMSFLNWCKKSLEVVISLIV